MNYCTMIAVIAMLAMPFIAQAVPPSTDYQGSLVDSNGVPFNGTVDVGIRLYSEATGGTLLWTQSPGSVTVTQGIYDLVIGGEGSGYMDALTNAECWIEVVIDGVSSVPRDVLRSQPYALVAADTADGVVTVDTNNNRLGVGTTSPAATLDVNGTVRIRGGNPGAGKVLTLVDPSGSAEWRPAVSGAPSGLIMWWSGSAASIPSGWVLCDGTSGTPDLRGRFVVGAGGSYAVNASGGSSSHTHSVDVGSTTSSSAGNHTHTFNPGSVNSTSVGNHTHSGGSLAFCLGFNSIQPSKSTYYWMGYHSGGDNTFAHPDWTGSTGGAGSHSHSFNWPSTTSSSAGSHSHTVDPAATTSGSASHLPPYYAMCFIMKL